MLSLRYLRSERPAVHIVIARWFSISGATGTSVTADEAFKQSKGNVKAQNMHSGLEWLREKVEAASGQCKRLGRVATTPNPTLRGYPNLH